MKKYFLLYLVFDSIIMEKKNDEKKEKKDADKLRSSFEQMAEKKKQPVAKELVQLQHTEVKKQEVSKETTNLAGVLKQKIVEQDKFEKLSSDELTVLESFENKRLFLSRIAIIANQSRIPLGLEPFKKADLEKLLNGLIEKEYIKSEKVGDNIVYFLTERGRYRNQ